MVNLLQLKTQAESYIVNLPVLQEYCYVFNTQINAAVIF